MEKNNCRCGCHKTKGILITLIGFTILLGNLDILSSQVVNMVWPTLLILLGLKSAFQSNLCQCCLGKSEKR